MSVTDWLLTQLPDRQANKHGVVHTDMSKYGSLGQRLTSRMTNYTQVRLLRRQLRDSSVMWTAYSQASTTDAFTGEIADSRLD